MLDAIWIPLSHPCARSHSEGGSSLEIIQQPANIAFARMTIRAYFTKGMNRLMTIVKNEEPNRIAPSISRVNDGPTNPSVS